MRSVVTSKIQLVLGHLFDVHSHCSGCIYGSMACPAVLALAGTQACTADRLIRYACSSCPGFSSLLMVQIAKQPYCAAITAPQAAELASAQLERESQ